MSPHYVAVNPYQDTKDAVIKAVKNAPSAALRKGQELSSKLELTIRNTWTAVQRSARDLHNEMGPTVVNTWAATHRKATEVACQFGNDLRNPHLIIYQMTQEVSAMAVLTKDYLAGQAELYLPSRDRIFWKSFYMTILVLLTSCLISDTICVMTLLLGRPAEILHYVMVFEIITISIGTLLCMRYQGGNSDPAIDDADELIGMAVLEKLEQKQVEGAKMG